MAAGDLQQRARVGGRALHGGVLGRELPRPVETHLLEQGLALLAGRVALFGDAEVGRADAHDHRAVLRRALHDDRLGRHAAHEAVAGILLEADVAGDARRKVLDDVRRVVAPDDLVLVLLEQAVDLLVRGLDVDDVFVSGLFRGPSVVDVGRGEVALLQLAGLVVRGALLLLEDVERAGGVAHDVEVALRVGQRDAVTVGGDVEREVGVELAANLHLKFL